LATVIIKDFNNNDIQKIENGESITIVVNSEMITLESTDLEVVSEDIEGCLVASESNITVALDITLNEELINEGICRELINRIQNLRKETGLLVTDKINLKIQKDNIIEKAIFENKAYILSETLTQNLEFVNVLNEGLEIKFDNINTKISINKIS
jgi:isoleucyl-tRNA synthetase